ncbi:succinyldiaminopimelate transaminase [Curtobacterium flaccumfaciens]|uniref:succinyldiaminopimelate transaminase n=1 Tax=Curtobacterium flaccumfaciens TaxID=2035 RepID=UPI001E5D188D|nr:succinyldiaminopimelate transaminase [Curtobacterium allii]MCE0459643.1 succinyldiaminopimelate transaminase [Curtobacterium allii]
MPTPKTLPSLPFDTLGDFANTARLHPDGIIDLSIGSPVDPTPGVIREALGGADDAPSYPTAYGTIELRRAIASWYERRRGVAGLDPSDILPTIGSKEFIAGLPSWLDLGPGDVVVHPTAAYPTYAVGATLTRAKAVASDEPTEWPENTKLIWLNSPRNPDGTVLDAHSLRVAVTRARELGAVIAGDECYAEFGWSSPWQSQATPCILDPSVVGPDMRNVLSVYSLSKQSNLAGYRAGFVAGDREILSRLLTRRRHAGLIVPTPIQHAMEVAVSDDEHVIAQKRKYGSRRSMLGNALSSAGFRIDASDAGLFLWATRDEKAEQTLHWFAKRGLLVAPGELYSSTATRHIRLALTATDDDIATAARRITT